MGRGTVSAKYMKWQTAGVALGYAGQVLLSGSEEALLMKTVRMKLN